MSIKIKVPIKELEEMDVYGKVQSTLRDDPNNAYTVSGIMIQSFGVKPKQIENKPFRDWDKGLPSLYTKIRICLDKMKKYGLVNVKKHGKAWVYWWIEQSGSKGIVEGFYDRDRKSPLESIRRALEETR